MSEAAQRYRVLEKLESGGMAEVFRAESTGLQGFRKQVAIKRVLPHLSEKKSFISMFLDEARLSAQLSHSNCVQVFDIGVGDQAYFIVMEFVDGANLKSIAETMKHQGSGFPVAAAAFIAHEICKGLSYAHELTDPNGVPLQLVHRDMSPPNVLLTKYGEVKIVDFGLAKASSQLEKSEPGIIKGKFAYLSPEATIGQQLDCRADIFAVGIILWELLASQRLFLGTNDLATIKNVEAAQIPPISKINPKVPIELERIVNRALARNPDRRYPTARELGQALSQFMFSFAQPVSGYDIATIVQGTMRAKQRDHAPEGSIIDKLIEEALFEFTSLKDDDAPASGQKSAAAAPLNADLFLAPGGSASDLAAADLSESLEPDELAGLEDTSATMPASGPRSAPAKRTPPRPTGQLPPAAPGRALAPRPAAATRTSGAAIAIVVFLVLAVGAAAAAWFTGLIPHP